MSCKITKKRLDTLPSDIRSDVRGLQRMIREASRKSMLEWLQWNDRNGLYTDKAVREEYPDAYEGHRWRRSDAVKELRRMIYQDILPEDFCRR